MMIRKLLIVAGSALVLSMIALSSAWLIGGAQMIERMNKGGLVLGWSDDDDKAPHQSTTLAIDLARPLAIEAPVELDYRRGDKPELLVEGPARLVGAIHWTDGRLTIDNAAGPHRGRLKITVVGDRMPDLHLAGPGQIELNGLDQASLTIDLAGAANVEGSGTVQNLTMTASGAGNLDLEKLVASNATIQIAGLGNADLSVTDKLDASISGAGNVTLHRKPRVLNSQISGIGSIDNAY